jgi:hypothetical protein
MVHESVLVRHVSRFMNETSRDTNVNKNPDTCHLSDFAYICHIQSIPHYSFCSSFDCRDSIGVIMDRRAAVSVILCDRTNIPTFSRK